MKEWQPILDDYYKANRNLKVLVEAYELISRLYGDNEQIVVVEENLRIQIDLVKRTVSEMRLLMPCERLYGLVHGDEIYNAVIDIHPTVSFNTEVETYQIEPVRSEFTFRQIAEGRFLRLPQLGVSPVSFDNYVDKTIRFDRFGIGDNFGLTFECRIGYDILNDTVYFSPEG